MKKLVPNDAVLIPDVAKKAFSGVIFDVYQWPQTEFDGSIKTYEMLDRPDTVICIGITDENKIIVIEDEQPHTGLLLSFPGGKVDKTDESVFTAAQREMREETGFEFRSWRLVQVLQPHKKLEWFIHVLVAHDGRKVDEPQPEAGEKISVKELTFDEVKKLSFNKAGYLGEAQDLFEQTDGVQDLLNLPDFKGKQVDR